MQALGALLLVFAFAPIYRIMDTSGEARYREIAVDVADAALAYGTWGTVVTALLALVLAVLLPTSRLRAGAAAWASRLATVPPWIVALVSGAVATVLATVVLELLYAGYLTNVDEMASTVQARYLAHGLLAGLTHGLPEFWLIPNTLIVPDGLVSQYPPTHLLAIAAGEMLGARLLVGPVFFGLMVALLALALPRLLADRPAIGPVTASLVAVCPLLVLLSGGALNHTTTGALLAGALYAALRARDGGASWGVIAGLAVGLAVANRPLTGLVLGTVLTLGVWAPRLVAGERKLPWLAWRSLGTVGGGLPVALLLGAYNQRLFGSPTTLGYSAAFGPRHGLGFHDDPWGYPYGPTEALAFTSADLVTVGIQLMETLFPLTVLIGLYLLVGRRFPRAIGLLLAWAFLPLVANAAYWFHTARMLYEAAPAWLALGVLAAVDLTAQPREGAGRYGSLARDAVAWAMVVAVLGAAFWGAPARWRSFEWTSETLDRITAPAPPSEKPALVFVHASWNERTSSLLQGAGEMRQDSIITALRRNTSCALHLYAEAREARVRRGHAVDLPAVDLDQIAGTHPDIEVPPLRAGSTVRIRRGEPFPPTCARQLTSDRFGTVALAPLVWQGDLPGIEAGRPMFVRDFGPEHNQALLDLYPERAAYVFTPTTADGAPRLLAYGEGMALLWGSSAPPAEPAPGATPER